jgi:hypothetical protein
MRGWLTGWLTVTSLVTTLNCASAGPRRPKKAPVTAPASSASSCKVPADLDKQIATATATRDAEYAKALAAKKLKTWTGKVTRSFSRTEEDPDVMDAGPPPKSGSAASAPKGVQVEVGSGTQFDTPSYELVADASGTVFLVQRQPTGNAPYYVKCGCGPVGSGVRARFVRHFIELPAGTKYGGTVTISYPDLVPRIGWNNMQGNQHCQPPP